MTDQTISDQGEEGVPSAVVKPPRRFSIVWVLPILAAVIGVGLAYRTYSEKGPDITIEFQTANGISPGKTSIRFRDVEVGEVTAVTVADDLSNVVVSASLSESIGKHLFEGTRFWVVRPRVGAQGISGLSTLVSGSFIGMDPGPPGGEARHEFVGLEEPPIDIAGKDGMALTLVRNDLGGLEDGSPIFYRGLAVGEVVEYELDQKNEQVLIHVQIRKKYQGLVNTGTRFWDAGGIDVDLGWQGLEVRTESLQSILIGGVAFDDVGAAGTPSKEGDQFTLYSDAAAAENSVKRVGALRIIIDAPQLGSLEVGSPVYYREAPVGQVVGYSLHDDGQSIGVLLEIAGRYARLVRTNSVFANASGIDGDLGLSGVHIHMESLKALLSGGVAFATPDNAGPPAANGSVFDLQPAMKDSWAKWKPRISLEGGADSEKVPAQKVVPKTKKDRKTSEHSFGLKRKGHHWW